MQNIAQTCSIKPNGSGVWCVKMGLQWMAITLDLYKNACLSELKTHGCKPCLNEHLFRDVWQT